MSDTTEAVGKSAVSGAAAPVAPMAPAAAAPAAPAAPAVNVAPPVAAAPAAAAAPVAGAGPEVRRAHFQPLQTEGSAGARDNIGLLMDVVVTMTVQLGGTSVPLRDVLKMGPGSVVRLDRALGEPVDILINRELVGRGEVVVVDDHFGVRVTQLLDPKAEQT